MHVSPCRCWLGEYPRASLKFTSRFMEYVPGGSIRTNVLKYGKFREESIKSFTSQILQGLAYLHARGIIHGVGCISLPPLPVINLPVT
jgi:hypothetical protein